MALHNNQAEIPLIVTKTNLTNSVRKTLKIKNDTRGIRTLADKSNSLAGYHLNHSVIVSFIVEISTGLERCINSC